MSDEMNENEKFMSRWSRLKRDAEVAAPDVAARAAPAGQPAAAAPLQRQQQGSGSESAPPPLPPVDELTLDSDFRAFFHPKVDEDVKRSALKKLFSDPHFNVMDGLDTYIDDYSKSDPLPVEMLAQMKSAQKIFKWARNELEEGETAPAKLESGSAPALVASEPAAEVVPVTAEDPVAAEIIEADTETPPEAADASLPDLKEQK